MTLPSQAELRALLDYNPETGKLFWKERSPEIFSALGRRAAAICASWNKRFAGKEAFTARDATGYLVGHVGGAQRKAHRVIWKMVTGEEPNEVDHVNGSRADNRFENLRSVSREENTRNKRRLDANTSGVTGVSWHEPREKWEAYIWVGNRKKNLGRFAVFADAVSVRKTAEKRHGFHQNHGREAIA